MGRSIPNKEQLVALFENGPNGVADSIGESGSRLLDNRPGVGSYEIEKSMSLAFNGSQHCTLVDRDGNAASLSLPGNFVFRCKSYFTGDPLSTSTFAIARSNDGQSFIKNHSSGAIELRIGNIFYRTTDPIISIKQFTVQDIEVRRVGTVLSIRENDNVGTVQGVSTADFVIDTIGQYNNGMLWDISAATIDAYGVETPVFSNFLAQGGNFTEIVSEVGPNLIGTGFIFPEDWIESVEFGHEWGSEGRGFSNVENFISESEDYSSRTLWPRDSSVSIEGKIITYNGVNANQYLYVNLHLDAGITYTRSFRVRRIDGNLGDGAIINMNTYGAIDSAIALQIGQTLADGNWHTIEYDFTPNSSSSINLACSVGSFNLVILELDYAWVKRKDSEGVYVKTTGNAIVGKIPAHPATNGVDVYGNALTNVGSPQRNMKVFGITGNWDGVAYLSSPALTGSEQITYSDGTSTPTISAGRIDFTAGWCSKVKLDDNTDLVIESRLDSEQSTIYDVVGGNHATLQNATLGTDGFWSIEKEGSYLFANGFTEGEPDDINPDPYFEDVLANYNLGDGWTIDSDGYPVHSGAGSYFSIIGYNLIIGDYYLVTYTLEGVTAGSAGLVAAYFDPYSIKSISGTYTVLIKAQTTTTPKFYGGTGFNGRITQLKFEHMPSGVIPAPVNSSLSVLNQPLTSKAGDMVNAPCLYEQVPNQLGFLADTVGQVSGDELVDNNAWITDVNTTLSKGVISTNNPVPFSDLAIQNVGAVANETYEVTYTVINYMTGNIRAQIGSAYGVSRVANGTYTDRINGTGNANVLLKSTVSGTVLSVKDVSLRKVNDPINQFYNPDVRRLSGPELVSNSQYFFGQRTLLYSQPLSERDAAKALKYSNPILSA
jgi:hypothetical protein